MRVLLRLLRYTRPHMGWAAVAVVGMAGVALATVFLMYLVVPLFDHMLGAGAAQQILGKTVAAQASSAPKKAPNPILRTLQHQFERARDLLSAHLPSDRWSLAVLVLLTVFVKNALTYFGHYAFYRTGLATVKDLRDQLVDALLRQSPAYFQKQPTAVLMSRVTNDVEQITAAISDRFGDLFQDSFTVVGLLVYAFSLNFRFALAALVVAPLLITPIWHFSRKLRKRSHQSQQRLGEMNTVLDEVFKGHRVVQAFGMERFESARFREATRRHFKANLRARKVQALNAPVMEVLGVAGAVALIGYASHLISRGEMTVGLFTSFLFALYGMYNPIKRLNKLNLAMQMAIAAGERVFAVVDAPVVIADKPGAKPFPGLREAIRFEGVSFAYEPEKPVLRDFNLVIPAGKVVALVGPSGAGKSTVAQLLPRFWDVDSGVITADGVDIREFTLASWRAAIGLVTQETLLFNTTIRANIAYGQERVDEEKLRACARAAFAEEFILEFPEGYDTMVGEAGVKLSGGQRQRIAVARALYKDPPILILDEATSALDAEAEAVVQKALENLMRGRTTLVIAHRLATVRNADWIAVMDQGRVVEEGTHGELLARGGLYARLAELQGLSE
ncbi:MAG: ABC transporter ATP-binding protein [Thermoanaerobaculum sp.]